MHATMPLAFFMLFSFIGLVYCLRFNDKKNRILPPVNQRIIGSTFTLWFSWLLKKEKQKAAQACYANGALLLFRAVQAK